jgi:repressor LexA
MATGTRDKILKYIGWHWDNLGYAPTYRAICAAVGVTSTSTVSVHLKELERQGLIKFGSKGRNIRLVNNGDVRYCAHDWRVRKIANPMPLQCKDCGKTTEVEYTAKTTFENAAVLRYVGNV